MTSLRAMTTPRTSGPSDASCSGEPPAAHLELRRRVRLRILQETRRRRSRAAPTPARGARGTAHPLRGWVPERSGRLAIGDEHPALRIERHNTGGHGRQHCRGAPSGLLQRALAGADVGRHALECAKYRLELAAAGCECAGMGWPLPSARAERRSSATGRESAREARPAPRPAPRHTPASVARSSTSARSSCRTASEGSSASCGVASTPRSEGKPGCTTR